MDFSAIASGLQLGISIATLPTNLALCFAGAVLGTLVGVLPGVGPVVTISLLLPITFHLESTSALIMLAGIYYGAQYGGSTAAILMKIPGETSAVVTCLDGHALARQGRAGTALGIAAIGSFIAGTFGTIIIVLFAPSLASLALNFGPAESFSLLLLGLVLSVTIAQKSIAKAIPMVLVGMLLGMVGADVYTGLPRFTFDIPQLRDGIEFAVVAMGVFGFGEIMANLEARTQQEKISGRIDSVYPKREDWRRSWKPILRGCGIGTLIGILPGTGAAMASFASYTIEKKSSRRPEEFGRGAIEGVAGPEAANNAAAQTNFIPLLTLGLPAGAVMALMAGAMMIHGINPSPEVIVKRPDLFWGLVVSMFVGNAILLVLNLNLIRVWVRVLSIPYKLLFPAIMLLCAAGIYSLNGSTFDILLAVFFGALGYFLIKVDCEPAPLLIGFVLGPMVEENLRRALLLSNGDWSTFIERPLSAAFLALAVLAFGVVIVHPLLAGLRTPAAARAAALEEDR